MTTRFLYDGDELVGEYDAACALRRYVHGAGVETGADSPNARSGNGKDGRAREAGDQTSSMPGSTRREREVQEQREINTAGGVDNLDNQKNSVSKKWEELGIDLPK